MRPDRLACVLVVLVVLVIAAGCQQDDRAPEEPARPPERQGPAAGVPESAPAPEGVAAAGPADAAFEPTDAPREPADRPSAEPFAAGGLPPAIRMGRRAQQDGQILDSDRTHVFMAPDQIHISISVPEGTGGAQAVLSIQNQGTNQEAWQEQRSLAAGDSFLTFDLGPGRLAPGDYVAVVKIDDRNAAQQSFKVSPR